MTRIYIQARGLSSPISATVEPGGALLIGRAPDPQGLDWNLLRPKPPLDTLVNAHPTIADYNLDTLAVPSPRASANHLLVLHDAALISIYDLVSRNGSWTKLDAYTPVVMTPAPELTVSLAGQVLNEPRITPPANAEWADSEDFGASIVRALTSWLAQYDAPVQCMLCAVESDPDAMPLAPGQAVRLRAHETVPVVLDSLHETARQYVHDQNARFSQLERRASGMIAASPAIRQVLLRLAESAAGSRRTILIGPTGVGKELLARSYHGYSPRSSGPFVTVNCALLEKDLLHAQLFGARRGSFTGAVADVVGLIEAANGGTLFLDELGEMSADVQKALLRFLDSRGEYYRLGDARPRTADVQLVCATNLNLDSATYRSARFRDDLWYRLASTVIRIPTLGERPEDLRAFLYSRTMPKTSRRVADCFTADALATVLRDPWPGNFRDLENFIARLPPDAKAHSIDLLTCRRVLKEGRASSDTPVPKPRGRETPVSASGSHFLPPTALRDDTLLDNNTAIGWERIAQSAVRAFLEDHGDERAGWDQLMLLVERYLKPLFVAQAAILRKSAKTGRTTNYSALARLLHISDGSTVKTHLLRFEERFAAMNTAMGRSLSR